MIDWPYQISVGPGFFALVDEEDYGPLQNFTWHTKLRTNGQRCAYTNMPKSENWRDGYAYTSMHRKIMLPPKHLVVDHADGNGLNNTRSNLRVCSQMNNARNMRSKGGASIYKGVHFDDSGGSWRRPWRASIRYDNKRRDLGRYSEEADAAKAYDAAAAELYGEFALLNFAPDYQERAALEIGRK